MAQQASKKKQNKTTAQENKAQFQDGKVKLYIEKHDLYVSVDETDNILPLMSKDQIQTLPVDAVADMVATKIDNQQLEEEKQQLEQEKENIKNQKSNQAKREKQTPYSKFIAKASGSLADSTRQAMREQFLVGISEQKKDTRDSTQIHMDTYTPKVVAVLYDMNLLDPSFEEKIETQYPNSND